MCYNKTIERDTKIQEDTEMKIVVTYDTVKDGERGETSAVLEVLPNIARNLVDKGQSGIAEGLIENVLQCGEMLNGGIFVEGSIKSYQYLSMEM